MASGCYPNGGQKPCLLSVYVLIDTVTLDQRCDFVYYNIGGEAALNPYYNQNYTREEIDAILAKIKSCVEKRSLCDFSE